jgi:hypothetical protein
MKYQHIIAAAVATALLASSASFALAEATSTTATSTSSGATTTPPVATTTPPAPTSAPLPTIDKREYKLEIGPKGRVNIMRGNIESISGDTIRMRTWGGVWTVKVLPGTEIIPRASGTTSALARFGVGDYVGVQGTISTTADFTVEAKVFRNWTERKELRDDQKGNRDEMKDLLKDAEEKLKEARKRAEEALKEAKRKAAEAIKNIPRTYEGKVGTISGSSFTFTKEGSTITVNTSSSTKFINNNWNTMAFGEIQSGDGIRVFGMLASSTINADVVRDVSVPRHN